MSTIETRTWGNPVRSVPGAEHSLALTVASIVGTDFLVFTFDAPAVSNLNPRNGLASAISSLTIWGLNFGTDQLTPTATLVYALPGQDHFHEVCTTTSWVSTTDLQCALNYGSGAKMLPVITVAARVGCATATFSFDAPIISRLHPYNIPPSAGTGVWPVSFLCAARMSVHWICVCSSDVFRVSFLHMLVDSCDDRRT